MSTKTHFFFPCHHFQIRGIVPRVGPSDVPSFPSMVTQYTSLNPRDLLVGRVSRTFFDIASSAPHPASLFLPEALSTVILLCHIASWSSTPQIATYATYRQLRHKSPATPRIASFIRQTSLCHASLFSDHGCQRHQTNGKRNRG